MKKLIAYSSTIDIVVDDALNKDNVFLALNTGEVSKERFSNCIDASRAATQPQSLTWV